MASSLLLRRLPSGTKHAAQRILTTTANDISKRSMSTVISAAQQQQPYSSSDGIQAQCSFFSGSRDDVLNSTAMMMQRRSFADVKTAAASETSNEEETNEVLENEEEEEEEEESLDTTDGKKPSPLESLPENYTPGHALQVLRTKGAGGAAIRRTEFNALCRAARPGWKKDANTILAALLDFKRINSFLVDEVGAKLAMEGMMRSMMPSGHPSKGVPEGERRLLASLFVMEAFAEEGTGLCFSAETEVVDAVLKELGLAVKECGLKLEKKEEQDEEDGEVEKKKSKKKVKVTDMTTAERVIEAVYTTVYFLNRRADPSEKKMKKRAARKFVKQLVTREGPSADTAHYGAQICLDVGGLRCAKDRVVIPYRRRRNKTSEKTNQLLEKAREDEEAAAAAAAAAEEEALSAEDENDEEGGEEEEDASNDDENTEK